MKKEMRKNLLIVIAVVLVVVLVGIIFLSSNADEKNEEGFLANLGLLSIYKNFFNFLFTNSATDYGFAFPNECRDENGFVICPDMDVDGYDACATNTWECDKYKGQNCKCDDGKPMDCDDWSDKVQAGNCEDEAPPKPPEEPKEDDSDCDPNVKPCSDKNQPAPETIFPPKANDFGKECNNFNTQNEDGSWCTKDGKIVDCLLSEHCYIDHESKSSNPFKPECDIYCNAEGKCAKSNIDICKSKRDNHGCRLPRDGLTHDEDCGYGDTNIHPNFCYTFVCEKQDSPNQIFPDKDINNFGVCKQKTIGCPTRTPKEEYYYCWTYEGTGCDPEKGCVKKKDKSDNTPCKISNDNGVDTLGRCDGNGICLPKNLPENNEQPAVIGGDPKTPIENQPANIPIDTPKEDQNNPNSPEVPINPPPPANQNLPAKTPIIIPPKGNYPPYEKGFCVFANSGTLCTTEKGLKGHCEGKGADGKCIPYALQPNQDS